MSKILFITGANGFIGSHLVEKALEKEYKVVALVRSNADTSFIKDLPIDLIEVDYFNYRHLVTTFNKYDKIDLFVHCAGVTESESPSGFESGNVQVTENLLKTLSSANLKVNHFLLLSSLAARGPYQPNVTTDHPISSYGRSKLNAENLLAHFDFSYSIVRPTAVYGPRDSAFLELVRLIKKRIEISLGDPKRNLTFIHVEDLCELIFYASDVKLKMMYGWDQLLYSESELNDPIKKAFSINRTIRIQISHGFFLKLAKIMNWLTLNLMGESWTYSVEKADELAANWQIDEINAEFTPKYNLKSGIRQTISWYRDHGLV